MSSSDITSLHTCHFLPIRAISSALAAALVLMSWFLARSMRTLRMLVGTSRDRAKREPCWALFGTWGTGRWVLARLSTVWCSERSSEFNTPLRFKTSTARTSLCVSSSRLWEERSRSSSRARRKHTWAFLMIRSCLQQRGGTLLTSDFGMHRRIKWTSLITKWEITAASN